MADVQSMEAILRETFARERLSAHLGGAVASLFDGISGQTLWDNPED